MKIEFQTPKNGRKQTAIVTTKDNNEIELNADDAINLFVDESFRTKNSKSWDEIAEEIFIKYQSLWKKLSKV